MKLSSLWGRGWGRGLFLLLLLPLALHAQDFQVSSFRTLPNDLTASRSPVYDLNGDACALIKVVGDTRFVFDSPLGIVKRTEEVGEVWIYLPQGSMQLTIRHPWYGVLRDYRLGDPLVANVTYEMVLTIVQKVEIVAAPPVSISEDTPVTEEAAQDTLSVVPVIEDAPKTKASKPSATPLRFMALGNVGISTETVAYGLRVGILRRHGVYLMAETDFSSASKTDGECDASGIVKGTSSAAYYTGNIERSLLKVMGGGIHRIVGGLYVYEGIGYGRYLVVWEASNGKHYKNTDDSAVGLSAEVGAMYRIGKFALSAGASILSAKHWEASIGIGMVF